MPKQKRVTLKSLKDLREALDNPDKFKEVLSIRKPRYDHRSLSWIVENCGVEHRFDTEAEAATFYEENKNVKDNR